MRLGFRVSKIIRVCVSFIYFYVFLRRIIGIFRYMEYSKLLYVFFIGFGIYIVYRFCVFIVIWVFFIFYRLLFFVRFRLIGFVIYCDYFYNYSGWSWRLLCIMVLRGVAGFFRVICSFFGCTVLGLFGSFMFWFFEVLSVRCIGLGLYVF